MSLSVPAVPQDEPEVFVAAGIVGEAAEILALVTALLAAALRARVPAVLGAAPETLTAAARFLETQGADPLPALDWLAGGAGRLAGELEAALSFEGIAVDRVLPRYRRQQ